MWCAQETRLKGANAMEGMEHQKCEIERTFHVLILSQNLMMITQNNKSRSASARCTVFVRTEPIIFRESRESWHDKCVANCNCTIQGIILGVRKEALLKMLSLDGIVVYELSHLKSP